MENLTQQKLTTNNWKLYNFIKERTFNGKKTTVKDICEHMPDVYVLNAKESNYSNCPRIYEDVDILNASFEIEKIIIKDNNNFHLATEDEANKYAEKIKIQSLKKLKKYWVIANKISADGNGKLISNQGYPIDEHSKARAFVESFIEEIKKPSEENKDASASI